ncbi:Zinc finger HIT domain-containing protein 1 [Paragonimus heterotremus]|uniref:Zinc finger HIT domain-containing protein 1 n=1 Tax=Paragonimus heterotremus TaxID=100268 RepID=A0A8J4SIX1_9TREM|nr:Zinc finger HIT domain-containing protein 1 [Paragonimus heterotremus]
MDSGRPCAETLELPTCECINSTATVEDTTCDNTVKLLKNKQGDTPEGAKTSDYYRIADDLPIKFNEPDLFKGYEDKPINPMYRTTNSEYGRLRPNVHTMNVVYHTRKRDFTNRYLGCGNYRNHSLNTGMDRKII